MINRQMAIRSGDFCFDDLEIDLNFSLKSWPVFAVISTRKLLTKSRKSSQKVVSNRHAATSKDFESTL
jgi:hypothetical protein